MENDIEYADCQVSIGRDLSSIMDADHPVQDERWPPGQETIDCDQVEALGAACAMPDSDEMGDLTPRAVEVASPRQGESNAHSG
eukprot:5249372-Pyramimonas_sp.AAC.1